MSFRYKEKFVDQPSAADIKRRLEAIDGKPMINEMNEKKIRWINKRDSDRPTFTILWVMLGFFILFQLLLNFGRMTVYDQVKGPISEGYEETLGEAAGFLSEITGMPIEDNSKKTASLPAENRW